MSHFGDSFNITRALSSPSYAKTIWCNYMHWKKDGLSPEKIEEEYGVSAEDIGQIETRWQNKLASWKSSTALDENKYIIDDSDSSWDDAYKRGQESIQKTTGYEGTQGQKNGQIWNNVGQGAALGARVAASACKGLINGATTEFGEKVTNKMVEKTLEKTGEKGREAATKASEKAGKKGAEGAFILIACALDGVSAATYRIAKPNDKQHNVVKELTSDMDTQMSNTAGAQRRLNELDEENIERGDDANAGIEEANTSIVDTKTEYDIYKETVEYYDKEKTRGHEFTEDEAEVYEECIKYMTENPEDVKMTQEEAGSRINEIYDEMANSQEEYDAQAETIASVEGVTDYAASIDKTQKTLCYVEGGIQTASAGFAGIDAYKAGSMAASTGWCGLGVAYGAAAAVAGVAAASDVCAATEQFNWAEEAGKLVKSREGVEKANAESLVSYDENIDHYALYMEDVEGLELIDPDDMEAPTETDTSSNGTENLGDPNNPDDPNKKK
ncbi:MAG: hypothetical protein MJ230_06970 [bacterium]|nr:hypothetical protein [bacterium]